MNRVLFSSVNMAWETPDNVYSDLDNEFHFDFDPCHKESVWDGCYIEWGKSNFVNPPYGHSLGKWLKAGYEESLRGKTVVFLIPSRTDTRWWHDYVMKADEIRFIKGRLKFKGATNSAPFPSCVVIFKGTP
jgi:hypothetical protein